MTKRKLNELSERVNDRSKRLKIFGNGGDVAEELLLHIFSYLNYSDLANCMAVSRRWSRIASDNILWRNLYFKTFPSKDYTHTNRQTWKFIYKVRHNWSKGRYSINRIETPSEHCLITYCDNQIFQITSTLNLKVTNISGRSLANVPIGDYLKSTRITAFSAHALNNSVTLAVGYSSGSFTLLNWYRNALAVDSNYINKGVEDPVVGFACDSTLVVTYSLSSAIRLFAQSTQDYYKCIGSAKSLSDCSNVALSIRRSQDNNEICVSIAFPQILINKSWSICLQELHVGKHNAINVSRRCNSSDRGDIFCPTSVAYEHPYLIAGHSDNTLSLYMVDSTRMELVIGPVKRLWGHASRIEHVAAIKGGKAISISGSGREIRWWDLERYFSQGSDFLSGIPFDTLMNPLSLQDISQTVGKLISFNDRSLLLEVIRDKSQSISVYDFS